MVAAAISARDFTEGFRDAAQPIDFRPLCSILAVQLQASCKGNIDRGQSPDGTPFLPLKRPRPNSKGGDLPLQDTGALRSSIVVIHVGDRGFVVGSNLEYSAIHQFGGRIVPRNGKYLAIPATVLAQRKGSPRNWGEGELKFSVIKKDGGFRKVLVETKPKRKKRGAMQEAVVQYFLAKEVTIPARPYLGVSREHADDMADLADEYVADTIVQRLRKRWGQSA